ncbi:MAG TPA: rod-binding protein [Hyphomicrobium sp.]|jgi:Rod binding domain-containing protein
MPAVLQASATDLATWTVRQTVQLPASDAAKGAAHTAPNGQSSKHAANRTKDVGQQFEALYLRQMLEASMPKDSEALFGKGTSGTMWRSMLADSLATALSKSGTIGIAKMVMKAETERAREK